MNGIVVFDSEPKMALPIDAIFLAEGEVKVSCTFGADMKYPLLAGCPYRVFGRDGEMLYVGVYNQPKMNKGGYTVFVLTLGLGVIGKQTKRARKHKIKP